MLKSTGKFNAKITAIGKYVPDTIYDNKYFEKIVDTSDEWIQTRTGIKERRILKEGAVSDMGVEAIKDTAEKFNV
ncbi:MAG: 3-oxoacyl-ACP synthase, partial [Ignavibacteria bacterium]|nr:3-oxoacyl-ACP synthase [Ignavibacteria bacterium]